MSIIESDKFKYRLEFESTEIASCKDCILLSSHPELGSWCNFQEGNSDINYDHIPEGCPLEKLGKVHK